MLGYPQFATGKLRQLLTMSSASIHRFLAAEQRRLEVIKPSTVLNHRMSAFLARVPRWRAARDTTQPGPQMDAKRVGGPYDPCPFVIRGIDSDNGNEFFSHHPLAWDEDRHIIPVHRKTDGC